MLVDDDLATSRHQGRAGAGRRPWSRSRRSAAPRPRRAPTWPPSPRSAGGSSTRRARWPSPWPPARTRATPQPAFTLPDDLVELGVGIHGERGTGRVALRPPPTTWSTSWSDRSSTTWRWTGPTPVIAIVNGLGGTHPLELSVVARRVHHAPRRPRHRRRPQPRRLVRHLAGHAGGLGDPRPRRRRAAAAVGRPRPYARPDLVRSPMTTDARPPSPPDGRLRPRLVRARSARPSRARRRGSPTSTGRPATATSAPT